MAKAATSAEAAAGPATDSGHTGTRPPAVHAYLRWGSWVGADRDGHPHVTADTTREPRSPSEPTMSCAAWSMSPPG